MSTIPAGPFLGHSLVFADGETMGEKRIRRWPNGFVAEALRDTMRDFPPTRVSILEFERDMRQAQAALDAQGDAPEPGEVAHG